MKKIFQTIWARISDGLEKSTVGTLVMFGCFGCIAYLTAKEGGSDTVESLITTAMIVAATLMGVNSVADIFKINRTSSTSTTTIKGGCNSAIPPESTTTDTYETSSPDRSVVDP